MGLRSDGEPLIIDEFGGINDLIDEIKLPKDFVRNARGGYFSKRKDFERIPGKLMMGTSTALGSVISIRQLEFVDRQVVVIHTSTVYYAEDNLSSLTSSTASALPLLPFIEQL